MRMARVLVVDDNADIASILAALIQVVGHEARFCLDCREALELTRSSKPDVVFIDIAMPHINGFECARQLRDQLGPSVRLIAMSGYPRDSWQNEPNVFEQYLLKPVTSKTVIQLIGESPDRKK